MKRIACFVVVLAAAAALVFAASGWKEVPGKGSFKIDRVWRQETGGYHVMYVLVSYRNTTSKTFEAGVTIQCNGIDARGQVFNTNQRSFFAHEYGPIRPGFRGTVKIPLEYHAEVNPQSADCWIKSAR